MPNHYRLKVGHPISGSEGNTGPFVANPAVSRSSLTLVAADAGTRPWAAGHQFAQGHLPAGQALDGVQTTVVTTWPDGSAKHVIAAGITAMAAATHAVSIGAGTQPTGTALSTASLKTQMTQPVTFGVSGHKDWTFDTASHIVGASIVMTDAATGNPTAGTVQTWSITVNNGATISGQAIASPNSTTRIITGNLSGGTVNGYQTVTITMDYLDANSVARSATRTIVAYVRTGGGIEWNGAAMDYAASNVGLAAPVSLSGTDWDAPFETLVSGPVMSSWTYRKAMGTDPHLVAWAEVRLWATGAVEVLPWIENGYLNTARPCSQKGTFTFTMGGTQRFSAAIDIPNRCRAPLISGTALTHWLGTDPGVSVLHDAAYMQAAEVVPTYSGSTPGNASTVTGMASTFTPLQQGNMPADMGGTGYDPSIGLLAQWDVIYLTGATQAARLAASGAAQRNAYSYGRYGIHHRDETTNRVPRLLDYPTTLIGGNTGISSVGSSTTSTFTPTATGTTPQGFATSHQPSAGYMAALITGRRYFAEELQFAAMMTLLKTSDALRQGDKGIYETTSSLDHRGSAWGLRQALQALVVTPTAHPLHVELKRIVGENVRKQHAQYVAQANNTFGFMQGLNQYSEAPATIWGDAGWQQNFYTSVHGFGLCLGIDLGATDNTKWSEFFAWNAKSVVGRFGGAGSTEYLYRDAAPYVICISPSKSANFANGTGPWFADWGEVYTQTMIGYGPPAKVVGDGSLRVAGVSEVPSATGYWGNLQPALSYAVRHGVAGASAARILMTGASNWAGLLAGFNVEPEWGQAPSRDPATVPAWIAARVAALSVGQSADVTATTNLQAITDMTAPVGPPVAWARVSDAVATDWPGKFTHDTSSGRLYYVGCGAGHIPDTPAGQQTKELALDLATGQFSARWGIFAKNVGHGYDCNPSRTMGGLIYRRPYNDDNIYRATVGGAWELWKDISTFPISTEAGFDVFPNWGTQGSLIYAFSGTIYRVDIANAAGSGGMSTVGSIGGSGSSYHVCSYHPGISAIVAGGGIVPGTGLYKIDSSGTITLITSSLPSGVPAIASDGNTSVALVPDPAGGTVAYVMDPLNTGKWFRLNLLTGAYTDMGSLPAVCIGMNSVIWASVPGAGAIVGISGRGNANSTTNNSNLIVVRTN